MCNVLAPNVPRGCCVGGYPCGADRSLSQLRLVDRTGRSPPSPERPWAVPRCLRCSRTRGVSSCVRRRASANDGVSEHGQAISVLIRREVLMSPDPRTVHSRVRRSTRPARAVRRMCLLLCPLTVVVQALLPIRSHLTTPSPEPEHRPTDPLPSVPYTPDTRRTIVPCGHPSGPQRLPHYPKL
jgi:hypothetical protein